MIGNSNSNASNGVSNNVNNGVSASANGVKKERKKLEDLQVFVGDGKVPFVLTEKQQYAMDCVLECRAIEQGEIAMQALGADSFRLILQILEAVNYEVKSTPQVQTNVLKDVIQPELAARIQDLNARDLNTLYRAAHYLKIPNMRKAIAAVVSCKVYFGKSPTEYSVRKGEFQLSGEVTHAQIAEYKERFPFMN